MSKSENIAYVVHPVTAEQKKEIRSKGFRIIDAQFAPEGADIIDLHSDAEADDAPKVLTETQANKLTVPKLQAILTEKGITFETDANKAALVKLVLDNQ